MANSRKDGGGDHNVAHIPVQVVLICLVFHLNVDMLVAMCTCPTQSCTNVAERVMSILNFALQHCATERDSMEPQLEKILKTKNNMTQLRDVASKNRPLQDAFMKSMSVKQRDKMLCGIKNFFKVIQQRINPSISYK